MTRLTIPGTELSVSPIGMGTIHAGLKWDGKETARMLDGYLDLGGNLLDTAHVYSDWVKPETARSERYLGEWLQESGKRNRVVLMTKGGHPDLTVERPDNHISRMTKADMEGDLDSSLEKLRTDYIDVYFYHRDDPAQTVDALVEAMQDFVRAGKIRYYACSNWSTERMKAADEYAKAKGYRGFVANEALLNLGSDNIDLVWNDTMFRADEEMRAYHRETPGNLLVPYSSLAGGYFSREPGDEKKKRSFYDGEKNKALALRVKEITGEYGVTASQVLLAWLLSREFACAPLFGPSSYEQLLDGMKTLEIPEEVRREFSAKLL